MSYRFEQDGDIVIDGFESGIADTPYGTNLQTAVGSVQQTGMSDMRNVNIISIPGEASVGYQTAQASQTPISTAAYTVVGATDTFTYSGTALKLGTAVTFNSNVFNTATASALVIGGGAGGGSATGIGGGGGGGAGGYNSATGLTITSQAYTVTVGAGGAASTNGNDSTFSTVTSKGGGAGGTQSGLNGQNGASGGGASLTGTPGSDNDAGSTGNAGGTGSTAGGSSNGGGGGGAGAVGGNSSGGAGGVGGVGGVGLSNSISGSAVFYAGGGGGAGVGGSDTGGAGGNGGGGAGGNGAGSTGTAGTANRGAGGGGGGGAGGTGGAGGSGVVIISIPTSAGVTATGGTHTVSGGNDIWTFTSSGTWTPTVRATSDVYWVRDVTATTFKIGTGVDSTGTVSAAVDILADGSGTFTTVDLGAISQMVTNELPALYAGGIATSYFPQSFTYAVDTNGRAWYFVSSTPNWVYLGNTTISSSPPRSNGIAVWNGYLLIFRAGDTAIDYRLINDGTSSLTAWTYGWKSGTYASSARTFIDASSTLYWCNGAGIGSLIQIGTFDPTSAGTYTYTAAALSINIGDVSNCIEQLGDNLLIGGAQNIVYQWDKHSTGYTAVLLPEASTAKMVTVNSNTYIFAGNRGRIYITNGANVQLYKKIPDHLSGTVEPYFQWGGAMYSRNQLYFSVSAIRSDTGAAITQYGGIWAISTDTNALRFVNKLSYGTYAGFVTEIGQVFSQATAAGVTYAQVSLISGWYDGVSLYGADYVSTSPTPYSNYESYIDSDMIPIGTYLKPTTNSNIEYKLTVPMVAGEGIKFAYRQNFSDSFTTITSTSRPTGIFTSADVGSGISGVIQTNFQKSQWVQIRASMASTSSTPSFVRLREIRIR